MGKAIIIKYRLVGEKRWGNKCPPPKKKNIKLEARTVHRTCVWMAERRDLVGKTRAADAVVIRQGVLLLLLVVVLLVVVTLLLRLVVLVSGGAGQWWCWQLVMLDVGLR